MDTPTRTRRPYAEPGLGIDYHLLPRLAGFHVRFAQTAVVEDFVRSLSDLNLTPTQFTTLTLVGSNPGLSQSRLAEAAGIERSSMLGILRVLEKRGLVRRARPDRRTHALTLSPDGAAILARAVPLVEAHDRRITARLSDDEVRTLVDLLDRVGA